MHLLPGSSGVARRHLLFDPLPAILLLAIQLAESLSCSGSPRLSRVDSLRAAALNGRLFYVPMADANASISRLI